MLYDMTDYSQLIQFNKNGLIVADYPTIRTVVTTRYRQIYGYDCDLSTGTADGQFIEMICLMVNNMLSIIKQMYTSLNPNEAQGKMLELICSLSNVFRKPATYSTATLTIRNVSTSSVSSNSIDFIDKNGIIWRWQSDVAQTFDDSNDNTLIVVCTEAGPVKAPAGWIYSTADNLPFTVTQSNDAIVGKSEETDNELRARRNFSLASSGLTTIESIQSALLSISGIDDVLIYNNATNSSMTASDTTSIAAHQLYICIRQTDNDIDLDTLIGQTIHDKITPGIQTAISGNQYERASYTYMVSQSISNDINWRKCKPVTGRHIAISLTKLANYDSSTVNTIKTKLKEYLRNLAINTVVPSSEIFMQIVYADPMFRGKATFSISSLTLYNDWSNNSGTSATALTCPDTYFDLSDSDIDITVS